MARTTNCFSSPIITYRYIGILLTQNSILKAMNNPLTSFCINPASPSPILNYKRIQLSLSSLLCDNISGRMAVNKTASLNLLCQTYNKQPLYNSTLHFFLMLYMYPFLSVRYLKEMINFHTTHMLKLIL